MSKGDLSSLRWKRQVCLSITGKDSVKSDNFNIQEKEKKR
jgi:hypothetical protein